jgi:hypothetical protein
MIRQTQWRVYPLWEVESWNRTKIRNYIPPQNNQVPNNTWWAFLKTWDQMKAASFCSLSLKGISPHAAYKKQQVSTKFLKTECESCQETCAWLIFTKWSFGPSFQIPFGFFCEISQRFFQAISNGREDNHDSSTAQKMINNARKSWIIDI